MAITLSPLTGLKYVAFLNAFMLVHFRDTMYFLFFYLFCDRLLCTGIDNDIKCPTFTEIGFILMTLAKFLAAD